MNMNTPIILSGLTLAFGLSIHATVQADSPFFMGLGDLPGGGFQSVGRGISADGTTVVGRGTTDSGVFAFRWTAGGGMVNLGDLPGAPNISFANATSADGSVVVGSGNVSFGPTSEAFRWTQGTGMVGLGDIPTGAFSSFGQGVSADGSVIVGASTVGPALSDTEAYMWTSDGGMVGLGFLPGGTRSIAWAISADSATIVGNSRSAAAVSEAFRWTESDGMQGLGFLPGAGPVSRALGASADGSTIIGKAVNSIGADEAVRWVDGAIEALGDLPGGILDSEANGASADGSIITGFSGSDTTFGVEAFVWDDANGMRALIDVLIAEAGLGPQLVGWELIDARVSADGLTFAGTALNPDGFQEAFIAHVPSPGALSLLGAALAPLSVRRRRG